MGTDHAPLFFISDAHLGADAPAEEEIKSARLHAFWEHVGQSGGDLVVVGDLFDFWFEFRHAVPSLHLDHLEALRRLVAAGHRVHYVAGNHDFWAGRHLRAALGIQFHADECALVAGGARVVFRHGDGWLPGEHAYRLMRGVLRHPVSIRLFQMLSPDLGFPLARRVSRYGKKRHPLTARALLANAQAARARLRAGADVLVTAHLHEPLHFRWPEGQWLVAGDWMRHFSFGRIGADGPELYLWHDQGRHRRVEPQVALPVAAG
jgi:UDP-2,3-diacylglucosamine hydrolase